MDKLVADMEMGDLVSNVNYRYHHAIPSRPSDDELQWSWTCSQVIGGEERGIDKGGVHRSCDEITAVAFNQDGTMLAWGTSDGCVAVYRWDDDARQFVEHVAKFRAHEHDYDTLYNTEVGRGVTALRFLPRVMPLTQSLLSACPWGVKLWKIRDVRRVANDPRTSVVKLTERRHWSKMHKGQIHSVSEKNDQELFLSADELQINTMHLEHTDQAQVVVKLRAQAKASQGVISCAAFSPGVSHDLAFSTSKGAIFLCDHRLGSRCDRHPKVVQEDLGLADFFGEFTQAISSLKFCESWPHYLLTRDYKSVRFWDVRKEGEAVCVMPVQQWLEPHHGNLLACGSLLDRFDADWANNGCTVVTGTYSKMFSAFDPAIGWGVGQLSEACTEEDTRRRIMHKCEVMREDADEIDSEIRMVFPEELGLEEKALHVAGHPTQNSVAISSLDRVFIMHETSLA